MNRHISLALIIVAAASFLAAESPSAITLQEEILRLARQRHELLGKNLQIRETMLGIQKEFRDSKGASPADLRGKLSPHWNALRQNQQEARSLSKTIRDKRRALANLLKTRKGRKQDGKTEPSEDVSNID